jgi:eukaryotic-like serine/threonine-protein kinase
LGLSTPAAESRERAPARSGKRTTRFVPGEVVAQRYRLIRELGEGGMGVVWVAHSLVLGVDVAIKLIRSGVADPDLASRMAREAQATATLGHPAIVRVFDFGATEDGDPFLVMELAHGETLAALLRREQRVSPVAALQLMLPIVDGLRCAHERGIVHRDIKPENVFVARDTLGRCQPKLLDFGIAKLEHHPTVSRLTQVGEVLGSPEFMSPEQARGMGNVDQRTDIWSLCVLIYEMLTGTVPFKVTNYNALMQAILHEQPVPTFEYAAGDRELWKILAKGLEKSRDRRWSSMTELGEALAFWLFDRGVSEDIAGNSLKAVWLGGTLAGLAKETGLDATTSGALDRSLTSPTLKLRVRRMRSRVMRTLSPRILVATGALLLAVLVLLSLRLAGESSTATADRLAPSVAVLASPPPAAEPAPAPIPTTAFSSLPAAPAPLSSASAKRKSKAPQHAIPSRSTSTVRAGQSSGKKSIRDFGF